MTGTNLPPEFAAELAKYQRQQQMAQMLQQQSMQQTGQPTQMVSGHAIKQSPLQGIAGALGMLASGKMNTEADAGIAGVGAKVRDESTAETRNLTQQFQQDPQAGIAAALASKYNKDLGGTWQKMYADRVNSVGGIMKDTDPAGAAAAVSGQNIPKGWQPPPLPAPAFNTSPNGENYVEVKNRKGESEIKFPPKAVNVTTKIEGKEGEKALDYLKDDLKTRQARAQAAVETLQANETARNAIASGAQMGGGEGLKQGVRKAAQAFGIEAPATAPTEQLQMALGQAVLAKARALAPVTQEDRTYLETLLGSVNTDPTALVKMLDIYDKYATKELTTYNAYVDTQSKNMESPYARDIFRGAGIGYEVPKPKATAPGQTAPQNQAPISLDDYLKKVNGK